MTATLRIEEGTPEAWPDPPDDLSAAAGAIAPAVVWRRIESWIAWRWGERPCTFTVEGCGGSWRAPLAPFTAETIEEWAGDASASVALAPGPLGVNLGSASHYRFAGMLGCAETPPEDVAEAFRRLAEYAAGRSADRRWSGASSFSAEIEGLRFSVDRAPSWLARAIHNSGAADLLRPYRRAP
jgi:hypothetical protein